MADVEDRTAFVSVLTNEADSARAPAGFRPTLVRCSDCGYPLRGLPVSGRCPECGADYDDSNVWHGRPVSVVEAGAAFGWPVVGYVVSVVGMIAFLTVSGSLNGIGFVFMARALALAMLLVTAINIPFQINRLARRHLPAATHKQTLGSKVDLLGGKVVIAIMTSLAGTLLLLTGCLLAFR